MITTLNSDWRSWIQINLQRNCSIRSMVEAMTAKDIDPATAAEFIATVAGEMKHPLMGNLSAAAHDRSFQYEASRLPASHQIQTDDRVVAVHMRIQRPEILLLGGVLSFDECDELIGRSRAKLNRSTTVDRATGEGKVIERRSSYGTFFHLGEDEFISRIDRRLSQLANWPLDHAEGIQIINYRLGGEYRPHFDFFPPDEAGSKVHTARGGQRIATIIMYLNDVDEGGETIFPEISLTIPPRKGDAVYFSYCNSLGQVDRQSLHGGNPVLKGEKWIATKWMRKDRRR